MLFSKIYPLKVLSPLCIELKTLKFLRTSALEVYKIEHKLSDYVNS